MSQLTDSQLTSQVYKRRAEINRLQNALPKLYIDRRWAKEAFRASMSLYSSESYQDDDKPTFHDVYVVAQQAAAKDRDIQTTLTLLKDLVELQTAQKREIKQRVNDRQNAKQAAIQAYLKQQQRYAERGQVNPKEQGVTQLKVA